jgi:hypothetical protein
MRMIVPLLMKGNTDMNMTSVFLGLSLASLANDVTIKIIRPSKMLESHVWRRFHAVGILLYIYQNLLAEHIFFFSFNTLVFSSCKNPRVIFVDRYPNSLYCCFLSSVNINADTTYLFLYLFRAKLRSLITYVFKELELFGLHPPPFCRLPNTFTFIP